MKGQLVENRKSVFADPIEAGFLSKGMMFLSAARQGFQNQIKESIKAMESVVSSEKEFQRNTDQMRVQKLKRSRLRAVLISIDDCRVFRVFDGAQSFDEKTTVEVQNQVLKVSYQDAMKEEVVFYSNQFFNHDQTSWLVKVLPKQQQEELWELDWQGGEGSCV